MRDGPGFGVWLVWRSDRGDPEELVGVWDTEYAARTHAEDIKASSPFFTARHECRRVLPGMHEDPMEAELRRKRAGGG